LHIHCDVPELKHVEDDEGLVGDIRDALVVMSTTPDLELNPNVFGANHRTLDMGFFQGSDNKQGFECGSGVESGIANVGLENRRKG